MLIETGRAETPVLARISSSGERQEREGFMKLTKILHLLSVVLTAVGLAWSQSSYTAAVRGLVTDASGAAVPGAKVTATETERNVPHTVVADDAGRYALTALPPGKYSLSVEAQ